VIVLAWLRNTFGTPGDTTLLIIAVLIFLDGRPLSLRWAARIPLAAGGGVLLAAGAALNRKGMVTWSCPTDPRHRVAAEPSPWA
jgi:hypothetical protein